MKADNPRHERRWASDTVPNRALSSESSPARTSDYNSVEEFVEVTLDLQDDNTIVLRSVEPATVINVDDGGSARDGAHATVSASAPTSAPTSRSTSIRRSSSNKLRQFSQELKAEVAKARQFSQEFKAELVRRFSWGHSHGSRTPLASALALSSAGAENGYASAMEARARRRERAQLDRTRSGAHKALRGLRFISTKTNGAVDAWNQVQSNFNVLAKDGFLYRADFAQCIGPIVQTHDSSS